MSCPNHPQWIHGSEDCPMCRPFVDKPKPDLQANMVDAIHAGNWILTFSGKKFYPMAPRAEDLDIKDIAHALSNNCRYTGHVKRFYSVAEHSVRCSLMVNNQYQMAALLHDASEAYLCDLARPVKRHRDMQGYRDAEHVLESCIMSKFNVDIYDPQVKQVDDWMLNTERRDLLPESDFWPIDHIKCFESISFATTWMPEEAESRFLERYERLCADAG